MASLSPANPTLIWIRQGTHAVPQRLPMPETRVLRALLRRAGDAARARARTTAEEALIRAGLEELRPALELTHALTRTYTLAGAHGEIQITLGTEFVLQERYVDPFALRARLEALGRPELLADFRLEARPDQRAVKDHACRELEAVGALQERRPTITLRSSEESAA